MTTSRRVDDGVDNGRSSTTDISEWEAGTEQLTVQDTLARSHKTRRLRYRDVTAPDAEEVAERKHVHETNVLSHTHKGAPMPDHECDETCAGTH